MTAIEFWHWWILGLLLITLEMFAPGTYFMWMGISAVLVGLLLWALPVMSVEYQILLFAVLAVASITAWKLYFRRHPPVSDQPNLNRRGTQYIGRVFTLTDPVVDNVGKIRVDDTTWKVRGADMAAGTKIRVTGIDGTVLLVERAHG